MRSLPEPVTVSVEEELARLPELGLDELKARWLELKGVPLPKFMRRGLMTRAVAYAIHEAAFGGLDPATRKRLNALAAQIVPTGAKPPPRPNRVKLGTRLIREWRGRVHEVTVVEGGYAWNGKEYPSLSVIARHITGTRWNGWVFFGLKQREEKKAGSAPTSAKIARRSIHGRSGPVGGADRNGSGPRVRGGATPFVVTADSGKRSDG